MWAINSQNTAGLFNTFGAYLCPQAVLSSVVVVLSRCGWEIPQFLAPVTQACWDHLDVLSSQLSILVMDIFQTTASVVLSGLTERIKRSSVQCCILIVTLVGNTCGGNLSIICSTSHVSPEPCLPSCGKAEKAPVVLEELEGRFDLSLAFLYLSLLCLWEVLSVQVAGELRYPFSVR